MAFQNKETVLPDLTVTFTTLEEYKKFHSEHDSFSGCSARESLIKPIVHPFYEFGGRPIGNLEILRSDDELVASGIIFEYQRKVIYTKDQIILQTFGFKTFAEQNDPCRYMYGRSVPVVYNCITFVYKIKEFVDALWKMINDIFPEYSFTAVTLLPYLIPLYIKPEDYDGNDLYDFNGTMKIKDFTFWQKFNGGNDMTINGYSYFAFPRKLVYAVYQWKRNLQSRNFKKLMAELRFFPGIGIEYQQGLESFYNHNS